MNRLGAEHRRSLPPPAVSWWLMAVPALLGTAIGAVVRGDRNFWGDLAMLEAIQRFDWPGVEALITLSNLAFSTGGGVVLGLLLLGAARLMHRIDLVVQLGVLSLLRVAGTGLKPLFDSPRPEIAYQQDPSLTSHTLGYPSGHAYTATIIASMLIIFVSVLNLSLPARRAITIGASLVTLLALVARIHIGVHWPSDTIGGVLFGIATIGAMQLMVDWLATPDADAAWRGEALGSAPVEQPGQRDWGR
jgi:undecaprenyl-diphosphatase